MMLSSPGGIFLLKLLGGSGEPNVVIVPVVVPPCGLVKEYDWNPAPRFVIAPV